MSRYLAVLLTLFFACFSANAASAEAEITDPRLLERSNALSASTLVGGQGWEVYEEILHPDYSRWAMGQIYEGREKFVRSLEEWWNYGMRVASRDIEMIGVDMAGDLAIIRFITTETFIGPDGPTDGFSGYVTNVWVKEEGDWMLLSAEISSINR
jgi:hypothetical protein